MKIALLREGGGIGDIISCFPVVAGLRKKYPDAEIHVHALAGYRELWEHCEPAPDALFTTSTNANRRARHWLAWTHVESKEVRMAPDGAIFFWGENYEPARLCGFAENRAIVKLLRTGEVFLCDSKDKTHFERDRGGGTYDWTIDLWCPAWKYEWEAALKGGVEKSRVEIFCREAGVEPSMPQFRLDEKDLDVAREWFWAKGRVKSSAEVVIGIQPFSTDPARDWPIEKWAELSAVLQMQGFTIIVFDSCPHRRNRRLSAQNILGHHVFGWSFGRLGALISLLDLMITPDSGLFHLAGAVETPAIELVGLINGKAACRPYPTHSWLAPKGFKAGAHRICPIVKGNKLLSLHECTPPCHFRRELGFNRNVCRGKWGCHYLWQIEVEDVVKAVNERLAL